MDSDRHDAKSKSTEAGGKEAPPNFSVITNSCYTHLPFLASFIACSTNRDAVIGAASLHLHP